MLSWSLGELCYNPTVMWLDRYKLFLTLVFGQRDINERLHVCYSESKASLRHSHSAGRSVSHDNDDDTGGQSAITW